MVNQDRRIQRRPRVAARAFQNLPLMLRAAGQLYKKGSRAVQPREKPRKKSKGKQAKKLAVNSLPAFRIGTNGGSILSGKAPFIGKQSVINMRKTRYGSIDNIDGATTHKALWVGTSDTGDLHTLCDVVAYAFLQFYLPKFGDIRSSNQTPNASVFHEYRVTYCREASETTQPGTRLEQGAIRINTSLESMATTLGAELRNFAIRGYYPSTVIFYRNDLDGESGLMRPIYRDDDCGRNKFKVRIDGRFRFNNVTKAGNGGDDDSTNINTVDANPLSGRIYTFRNQRPLFTDGYESGITSASIIAGIEDLNDINSEYVTIGLGSAANGFTGGAAFTGLDAPPLLPRSIWRNSSKMGAVTFPPGGYKTYTTMFAREETIHTFLRDVTRQEYNLSTNSFKTTSRFPPTGSSFMMCLRPTIKTSGTEAIKLAFDFEYKYKAQIVKRKVLALPTINDVQ